MILILFFDVRNLNNQDRSIEKGRGQFVSRILKCTRKVKASFIRVRFHRLIEPFSKRILTLFYLSKLSKWIKETKMPAFDDFYAKKHDYSRRYDLYRHVIETEGLDCICYLEFGVAQGASLKYWTSHVTDTRSVFVGFDTFTGLPEEWGHFKKGDMSTQDRFPDIDDRRCTFVKGLFQETLPAYLLNFESNMRKVIHLDADCSRLWARISEKMTSSSSMSSMYPYMNSRHS
jgi:hypothetical protein